MKTKGNTKPKTDTTEQQQPSTAPDVVLNPAPTIEPTQEPATVPSLAPDNAPVPAALLPWNTASIDEVLALQEQLDAKKEHAIKGLLARIDESKAQLKMLGYEFDEPSWVAPKARPTATAKKTTATTKKPGTSGAVKNCPYCGEGAGHDGKAHRYQTKKKAFTADEIAERKLLGKA
jgi:hypothetical protein